jgi:hypothetical protein
VCRWLRFPGAIFADSAEANNHDVEPASDIRAHVKATTRVMINADLGERNRNQFWMVPDRFALKNRSQAVPRIPESPTAPFPLVGPHVTNPSYMPLVLRSPHTKLVAACKKPNGCDSEVNQRRPPRLRRCRSAKASLSA